MRNKLITSFAAAAVLVAVAGLYSAAAHRGEAPEPVAAAQVEEPTGTPTSTPEPEPTATPAPTEEPTATPAPTEEPTLAPTQAPEEQPPAEEPKPEKEHHTKDWSEWCDKDKDGAVAGEFNKPYGEHKDWSSLSGDMQWDPPSGEFGGKHFSFGGKRERFGGKHRNR